MLTLGRSFNRNYNLRIPFLDGFYNIGIFYNNKSSFLLFSVESDFSQSKERELKQASKINMFKNIESSKFCETFINLHSYKSQSLDIVNQFKEIKPEYVGDINFLFNETLLLSKINVKDNVFFDSLNLYAFSLSPYMSEFIFLIAERQNIIQKFEKKVVRSNAIQIATKSAIEMIDEYFEDGQKSKILDVTKKSISNKIIKIED